MLLNLRRALVITIALGSAMLAGSAQAQDTNSYLYLAHAASGRNISAGTNPEVPIDVSVNGNCIAGGLSFAEIRGPFAIQAATVAFRVSKANAENPCSEPAVFTANSALAATVTYMGVLSLDNSNNITGQLYPLNLTPLAVGHTRAIVINATHQNLSVTITADPRTDGSGGQFPVPAGSMQAGTPPAGLAFASVYSSGNALQAGPVSIQTLKRNVYVYVFAGSATNGSVQLVGPKIVWGVF
jgi:hypothetical protein